MSSSIRANLSLLAASHSPMWPVLHFFECWNIQEKETRELCEKWIENRELQRDIIVWEMMMRKKNWVLSYCEKLLCDSFHEKLEIIHQVHAEIFVTAVSRAFLAEKLSSGKTWGFWGWMCIQKRTNVESKIFGDSGLRKLILLWRIDSKIICEINYKRSLSFVHVIY